MNVTKAARVQLRAETVTVTTAAMVQVMYTYQPRCPRRSASGQVCGALAAEWPVLPCCPLPVLACWEHLSADEAEHCHAIRDASARWRWTGAAGDGPDAPTVSVFRQAWPRAYESWLSGDDARLQTLWHEEVGISALAAAFARHPETIRARLVLLGVVGMPASVTAYAIATYRTSAAASAAPSAVTPTVAVPPQPRQPSPYERLAHADIPFHLRARAWLELAMLVECGACCADPGGRCTGPEAVDVGRDVVVCPARVDEIPEVTAERCPRCNGYLMDRPMGWHDTCWNHSSKEDRVALAGERTEVWDAGYRSYKRMLTIDVETATQFGCMECGVTPGVPCREPQTYHPSATPNPPGAELSHYARVRVAQSHRRARHFLATQETAPPPFL
ncbi:hypothetical protein LO763_19740 [Glycomyces sp. A-F 0318]|uniref:hypothetical protein n=1 Tax=Glycomyces amatae TaxID=2881355 RepID=UPI001E5B3427|nr:hypothetical protein [Glycomyces amatae]MCD0445845.1 hypothetical protein [Glycomyces amatae]